MPWVHPRSRGAASSRNLRALAHQGPSPLSRGSHVSIAERQGRAGSIPALAGQPRCRCAERSPARVHPRSRGAAPTLKASAMACVGPSPLSRGSRGNSAHRRRASGSIPALAGQPSASTRRRASPGVHPRSRGAALPEDACLTAAWGPSPLSRGSQLGEVAAGFLLGSIPALAGQPSRAPRSADQCRVHPRSRGAAAVGRAQAQGVQGPSPLSRGSHVDGQRQQTGVGSIPALAGQPAWRTIRGRHGRVHPRSRGAATPARAKRVARQGPSPLSRGSRRRTSRKASPQGSIPALAGQPTVDAQTEAAQVVHPRSRGAADAPDEAAVCAVGPSPLSRGSLDDRGRRQLDIGSIPALAGQPCGIGQTENRPGVHPRSRGAALQHLAKLRAIRGPSPLSRGSPFVHWVRARQCGSIPALAGQPLAQMRSSGSPTVHPRSRGAALNPATQPRQASGPSPLSRGSPAAQEIRSRRLGSIPALAGQPPDRIPARSVCGVHPRSRGAAVHGRLSGVPAAGPSPLSRGSPLFTPHLTNMGGSIPALAGQPRRCRKSGRTSRVHPRSRGAAFVIFARRFGEVGPSPLSRGSRLR